MHKLKRSVWFASPAKAAASLRLVGLKVHTGRAWWVHLMFVALLLLSGLISVLSTAQTHAQGTKPDPDLDRQTREIGADLRCPVCQNLSVADSPSPLAGEMRVIIRQKLEAGESRQDIMQYFVARYGEAVLLNPPQQGFTLLIWLGAAVALAGGAGMLVLRLRRAVAPRAYPDVNAPTSNVDLVRRLDRSGKGNLFQIEENDPYEATLDAELEHYKQGGRL